MKEKIFSKVEQCAVERSGQKLQYAPVEKIGTIIVDSFPTLGKLTALRFLEWVQQNPEGVVSLPTGKTPEYFIKYVSHYLQSWDKAETQKDLKDNGLDTAIKPSLKKLYFVQIDEFYPIDPHQQNSFYYYINKYYLKAFGFDPSRALLIDCSKIGLTKNVHLEQVWPDQTVDLSLRYRREKNNAERLQRQVLEAVDQWCTDYERKIRSLGGLGFFLGGIGPDGHIGFNVMGSDFHSTTRLTPTNYETQAVAAGDLGGIEVSRKRLVITIGLQTITFNPNCTALIIAAGEAKAKIVADAIQSEKHIRYPASALHDLKNARFYLTSGAAKHLVERQFDLFTRREILTDEQIEKVVIDVAHKKRKYVRSLTSEDLQGDRLGAEVMKHVGMEHKLIIQKVEQSLIAKLERGMVAQTNKVFLHTEPHHDDIMLGYLPYVVRNSRTPANKHFFVTLTSGFTAVTNAFMLQLLQNLRNFLHQGAFDKLVDQNYFNPNDALARNRDAWQYLDGVAANWEAMKDEGTARRLLRNLIFIFEDDDLDNLKNRLDELINYFQTQYPGKKDLPHIQRLKGMMREWEVDCLWGYLGFENSSVLHARLGFYKGEIFTEDPTHDRDVKPMLAILRKINPDIVTVALDPEASGPDTHYKVLQVMAEALKAWEKESGRSDIQVLGYRNVWFRYHPAEANVYIPVSLNMFATMRDSFLNAFSSQKSASFPSYEHDGPFSELAQKIQVEQYVMLKTCLGREFFNEHPSPLIRGTRGLVYLKSMTLPEFYETCRALRKSTENE
ncbi:MAG: glucosamine-6-phosphate deaminase [bacterium]